ncbi:MAG: lysine efflux permease [SAR116 cluster bacterium]|nr:lysine efflux permease [SAR116 cluster bacterium]
MISAALSGFALSLSLILAIGAQNSFVIRQGLLNQHVLAVVLFCGLSDMMLICLGVLGLGQLLTPVFDLYGAWLFALAALWLAGYGVLRLRDGLQMATSFDKASAPGLPQTSLARTISVVAVLTFANPHVYLDTVILLGSLSVPYQEGEKLAFTAGASAASLLFFSVLGFGARRFSRYMTSVRAWQLIDFATAFVMLLFAALLLTQITS